MKTQLKLVYFITPHSKRVCTHGLECLYIFTACLFFINPDMCVENCLRILAMFIKETPVLFLLSPGKMLLTLSLFQKWLGSTFPEDV